MKVACDKCLRVEDADRAKDWLQIRLPGTGLEYLLCPNCEDAFWAAVDAGTAESEAHNAE